MAVTMISTETKDTVLLDLEAVQEAMARVRATFPDANGDSAIRHATEAIDAQVALAIAKVLDRVE